MRLRLKVLVEIQTDLTWESYAIMDEVRAAFQDEDVHLMLEGAGIELLNVIIPPQLPAKLDG